MLKIKKNAEKISFFLGIFLVAGFISFRIYSRSLFFSTKEKRNSSASKDIQKRHSQLKVKEIKIFKDMGGRVDISKDGVIIFDRKGSDGYYDVYRMNIDGTSRKCLTCDRKKIPQKHNGQPAWEPGGEYIVFQSVDVELEGWPEIFSKEEKYLTSPGSGINNNLWVMDKEGKKFWQITRIGSKGAVLHPHFSPDGKKLLWTEMVYKGRKKLFPGEWMIKIGDFVVDSEQDEVKVENVISLKPGNMRFYETHGFSPDGSRIIFSATPTGFYKHLDIYTYDLSTGKLTQLTGPDEEWDEHAQYSPDGKKIVWISSRDIPQLIRQYKVKTDYWIMDEDGKNKMRLTFFNDPESPYYIRGKIENGATVGDNAWLPEGNGIIGYLIIDRHQADANVLIRFSD